MIVSAIVFVTEIEIETAIAISLLPPFPCFVWEWDIVHLLTLLGEDLRFLCFLVCVRLRLRYPFCAKKTGSEYIFYNTI